MRVSVQVSAPAFPNPKIFLLSPYSNDGHAHGLLYGTQTNKIDAQAQAWVVLVLRQACLMNYSVISHVANTEILHRTKVNVYREAWKLSHHSASLKQ
jgi:hypothetical protein